MGIEDLDPRFIANDEAKLARQLFDIHRKKFLTMESKRFQAIGSPRYKSEDVSEAELQETYESYRAAAKTLEDLLSPHTIKH